MANYLEYKGYIGTIEISAEDNVLYGKIHGINDLVTFEAESISDLKIQFQEAVDDYLELCTEIGKEPDKAYKGQFNVRIAPELHRQIALQAAKEDVALNRIVELALEEYLSTKGIAHLIVEKLDEIGEKVGECGKCYAAVCGYGSKIKVVAD